MELNEEVVMDYYLELIDEDKIKFLEKKPDTVKQVIDHINRLKELESPHDRIECARELWKLLFEAAMEDIDQNKYGYDELFSYFDEFVDFEELIFASDAFYRDHTLHSLWVYFLGEYLFRKEEFKPFFKDFYQEFQAIERFGELYSKLDNEEIFGSILVTIEKITPFLSLMESARCVASLTHDLGYPLNKIVKINKAIGKILPFFSISQYGDFHFQFESTQQFYIENFIEIIGFDTFVVTRGADLDYDDTKLVEEIVEKINEISIQVTQGQDIDETSLEDIRSELKDCSPEEVFLLHKLFQIESRLEKDITRMMRFADDFERYSHGIMSAFLLMKILSSFTDMQIRYSTISELPLDSIDIVPMRAKMEVLTAIANHTSRGYRLSSFHDLSAFLALVDEIEEFSRISRANQYRQYIDEFCRTNIYVDQDVMVIEFLFDNEDVENLDPERAFKGRLRRFMELFDISNLGEHIKIRLVVISKLTDREAVYEIIIEKGKFEARINGEKIKIDEYLRTREY